MRLQWHGPVFDQSGYAELTREILFALDKMGVKVSLLPTKKWSGERISLQEDDFYRLIRMTQNPFDENIPTITYQCWKEETNQFINYNNLFLYTLFETDRFPEPWMYNLDKFKKIFTFSNFNRDYWIKNNGIEEDKIKNIGFGINRQRFYPIENNNIINKSNFTFITNGDFVERKGFDILLKAYIEEFNNNEDVCLILKTHYAGFTISHQRLLKDKIKNLIQEYSKGKQHPKILFFGDKIDQDEMVQYYNQGNCFILPSRGEGLGMPFLEALACGVPCISSGWSAMTDYITNKNISLCISGNVKLIDSIEFIKKCPHALLHSWFEPDLKDLKEKMRYAFNHKKEIKKIGENARKEIIKNRWQDVSTRILKEVYI